MLTGLGVAWLAGRNAMGRDEQESSTFRDLERLARRVGNQLAWRFADAMEAARVLPPEGWAILGGDVWVVMDDLWLSTTYGFPELLRGSGVYSVFPLLDGTPEVYAWEVEGWGLVPWAEYCAYSGREALRNLQDAEALKPQMAPEVRDKLWYRLTVVTYEDYRRIERSLGQLRVSHPRGDKSTN